VHPEISPWQLPPWNRWANFQRRANDCRSALKISEFIHNIVSRFENDWNVSFSSPASLIEFYHFRRFLPRSWWNVVDGKWISNSIGSTCLLFYSKFFGKLLHRCQPFFYHLTLFGVYLIWKYNMRNCVSIGVWIGYICYTCPKHEFSIRAPFLPHSHQTTDELGNITKL